MHKEADKLKGELPELVIRKLESLDELTHASFWT